MTGQDTVQADLSRPVPGEPGLREIDLDALVRRWPALARAPVARLLLAEMLARGADADTEIARLLACEGDLAFRPARVLMQDYAGLPALLDIAALRSDVAAAGGDPASIGLSVPVDLVVDHSVMVMQTGPGAEAANLAHEYAQNEERFRFLRWAEQAFDGLRVVPPAMGIVHQMNLERFTEPVRAHRGWLVPDSLVGTDSHSTMCGGLGVLGWGVGGIEATAVLLDLPVALPAPRVVGVCLEGRLGVDVQATDLALQLTARLRELGVVGQIVEFFGPGLASLSVADRASVANMAPEYGATAGLFPFDQATADYIEGQGRGEVARRLRAWLARQPMLDPDRPRDYDRQISFDLSSVGLTMAGPKLPHQITDPARIAAEFADATAACGWQSGDVALAAITSCTITSNPRAMITAGLLARNARARGLRADPRIKTSFSPGSRAVSAYLADQGLLEALADVGFAVAGYGCMSCVGNSGELAAEVEAAAAAGARLCSVLSGNRNFEARIHPAIACNYLMSPALVIAGAILGHMRADLRTADLGGGVHLADIWPDAAEVDVHLARLRPSAGTDEATARAFALWEGLEVATGPLFAWPPGSSFFTPPLPALAAPSAPFLASAQPLLVLEDAITTDHISPVSRIAPDSPAGRHLAALGLQPADFGAYGARRGNPELMRKGTFANPRLANRLSPEQGWFTCHVPSGEIMTIEAAASRYQTEGRDVVIFAGQGYGIGSARDWAAKGTAALGVRAVIARDFERIHRTNLALVGVLPLQIEAWPERPEAHDLELDCGLDDIHPEALLQASLRERDSGRKLAITLRCRLDTAFELACWRAGGMLALARHGDG